MFALLLIVFAGLAIDIICVHNCMVSATVSAEVSVIRGIQIFIGSLQGVVAITTAAFSCRAVCCGRKRLPRAMVFTSGNTAGDQTFTTIPLNQIV